jgi:1-acyl-sn-glycerol-3-phosphate acyltransferase
MSKPAYALQWLRSLIFVVQAAVMMLVIGLVYFPGAMMSRQGARAGCHAWARWVRMTLPPIVGIKTEVRGTPPTDEVLVAGKHQSFLDIILIFGAMPAGKFIMKKQILYTPILGQYATRIGSVPVDRGKRTQAIKKMVADVAAGVADPGQLIIYPQGTRIRPGVKAPYKIGAGVLYEALGQDCVPVACNVGLFWPRSGIMRYPGTAVVEFLPRIPAGLELPEFMQRLETEIEEASDVLMAEAGAT